MGTSDKLESIAYSSALEALSPSTPPAFHRDCNFLFYPTAGVLPVRKPGAIGLHHHDAHPGAKPALNSGGPRRDRAGNRGCALA